MNSRYGSVNDEPSISLPRVERLFRCAHPFFGPIAVNGPPTTEQALLSGVMAGLSLKERRR